MLSKLKEITANSKKKLEEEYEVKDQKIFDFLLQLTEKAYAQLEELATKGKNRKYVIGYCEQYNFEVLIFKLYEKKSHQNCDKHINRILKKFVEKTKEKFDVPLFIVPSYYSMSYKDRRKYSYSEEYYEPSLLGDIYFDWSD